MPTFPQYSQVTHQLKISDLVVNDLPICLWKSGSGYFL